MNEVLNRSFSRIKISNLKILIILSIIILAGIISFIIVKNKQTFNTNLTDNFQNLAPENLSNIFQEESTTAGHPLSIEYMMKQDYPGSELVIEQRLERGSNYNQFIASYKSEGLKIFGLLTIPNTQKPSSGFPVIIFNHGYIPPEEYKTTERYKAYVDVFARNGYIVFKPDFRGHGNSEGQPTGAYYSSGYTIDVLNAVSSLKKFKDADPERIGMWGHSMGGNITLRSIVISDDIKVAVIWAGVVGSYQDLLERWRRTFWMPSRREQSSARPTRQRFIETYGTPEENPEFWNAIDPTKFINQISTPLQLHHGTSDQSVPIEFSKNLAKLFQDHGKTVEFYEYQGGDHNLSGSHFALAAKRSLEFFDKFLKGGENDEG